MTLVCSFSLSSLPPDTTIFTRILAGCTTGALAVAFAQPTDVVKVRFQAQIRDADGSKRYNGTMDAYKTIARDEGLKGLWKGKASLVSPLLSSVYQTTQKLECSGFKCPILSSFSRWMNLLGMYYFVLC